MFYEVSTVSSALSKPKSTRARSQKQLTMGLNQTIQRNSASNPVDFAAIAADIPKGKESKSVRIEKPLLSKTEALREQTNLNFSEYVETALTYFNACFTNHLSDQESQTNDAA